VRLTTGRALRALSPSPGVPASPSSTHTATRHAWICIVIAFQNVLIYRGGYVSAAQLMSTWLGKECDMVAVELNTRAPRCLWTAARRLALNASAIDSPHAVAHSAAE
jgi:hypothetical protein